MSDEQQSSSGKPATPATPSGSTIRLEPVSESFTVQQPWYRKIFGSAVRTQTVWKVIVVLVLAVGVIIGREIQRPQSIVTQATVGKASVAIYPVETTIAQDKSFQLWMTTDQPASTTDVTLTYDPTVIQLSREVIPTVMPTNDVTVTPRAQANKTGEVEFHVRTKTPSSQIAPGTTQIGTFFFTRTSGTTAQSTNIMIDQEKTKVVNKDGVLFTLVTSDAIVRLQ